MKECNEGIYEIRKKITVPLNKNKEFEFFSKPSFNIINKIIEVKLRKNIKTTIQKPNFELKKTKVPLRFKYKSQKCLNINTETTENFIPLNIPIMKRTIYNTDCKMANL